MKEKFADYQKAVEFKIEKRKQGEVWTMEIEMIENQKFYIMIKSEK